MDNINGCIRKKVKNNLGRNLNFIETSIRKKTDLQLLDSPTSASDDVHNSDFILSDSLNEQLSSTASTVNSSLSSGSTKEEDFASNSPLSTSTKTSSSNIICKWTNCDWPGHSDDLVEHIREIHVELQPYLHHYHDQLNPSSNLNYVCLWQGCKMYGKSSLCKSWLEYHVLQHSGPNPFKCIIVNCGQRFKTRSLLGKHVNNHFMNSNSDFINLSDCTHQDNHPNHNLNSKFTNNTDFITKGAEIKNSKSLNLTSNGLATIASPVSTPSKSLKKKKKLKRHLVNVKTNNDLFDDCTMNRLKCSLVQLNNITGLDIIGDPGVLTFHAKIVAKCKEAKTGLVKLLLRWQPEDIIDDEWVVESDSSKILIKKLPISSLPRKTIDKISDIFFPKTEIRIKQRRK